MPPTAPQPLATAPRPPLIAAAERTLLCAVLAVALTDATRDVPSALPPVTRRRLLAQQLDARTWLAAHGAPRTPFSFGWVADHLGLSASAVAAAVAAAIAAGRELSVSWESPLARATVDPVPPDWPHRLLIAACQSPRVPAHLLAVHLDIPLDRLHRYRRDHPDYARALRTRTPLPPPLAATGGGVT